jgi:hypothetical protein
MLVVDQSRSSLNSMKNKGALIASVLMLSLAGFFFYRFWNSGRSSEPQVYFYDLSAKKLFAAPQDAVPPIAGMDGPAEDAVRAVVYSPSGDCAKDQKIAYLEKYSAELKAQFEQAKRTPGAEFPRMSRAAAQSFTFVARPDELKWHAMDTEEAGTIVGEWRLAHPGADPVICTP